MRKAENHSGDKTLQAQQPGKSASRAVTVGAPRWRRRWREAH